MSLIEASRVPHTASKTTEIFRIKAQFSGLWFTYLTLYFYQVDSSYHNLNLIGDMVLNKEFVQVSHFLRQYNVIPKWLFYLYCIFSFSREMTFILLKIIFPLHFFPTHFLSILGGISATTFPFPYIFIFLNVFFITSLIMFIYKWEPIRRSISWWFKVFFSFFEMTVSLKYSLFFFAHESCISRTSTYDYRIMASGMY